MAVGDFTRFTRNYDVESISDLLTADVRMALVTSAFTPDIDESTGDYLWADASGSEIAAGNGYTAGGQALANDVVTAIANGFKYESDNVIWTASGGNIPAWRYAVMYVNGSLWGRTSPLIGYFIGDDTPADIPATLDGNPLQLTCPAAGWFDKT